MIIEAFRPAQAGSLEFILYNCFQSTTVPPLVLLTPNGYNSSNATPGEMMNLNGQKIIDRQVGRNAQLFAQTVSSLNSPENRYPYLRILISIIEQAHPEWGQAPQKDRQIAHLVRELSGEKLTEDEVAEVVRLRDQEKGLRYD